MQTKNLLISFVILVLGMAVIISGYLILDDKGSVKAGDSITTSIESKVLNLSQVSQYLRLSEEEVKGIIELEKKRLEETGSFSGKMFPYFTVNNNHYFYKDQIDEWLIEISIDKREYDTKRKRMSW